MNNRSEITVKNETGVIIRPGAPDITIKTTNHEIIFNAGGTIELDGRVIENDKALVDAFKTLVFEAKTTCTCQNSKAITNEIQA